MSLLPLPRKVTPQTVAQFVAQPSSLLYRRFPICTRAPSAASNLRVLGACVAFLLTLPNLVLAEPSFATNGIEYSIAGTRPGDQMHPAVALNAGGGYLVWEDNVTSSSGLAISAQRLDASFSASLSSFKVNSSAVGDHERPQVALLRDGGAAFVWQGGRYGFQHIYARFLSTSNTWLTGDVLVNSSTNYYQYNAAIATLNNGNVVVVWSSLNQYNSTSMQDVYGQVLSPVGEKIGSEFLINEFVAYNQRTPAITALSTGGFVVAWVSEQQRTIAAAPGQLAFLSELTNPSVDIYARLYSANAQPLNNEFLVNTDSNVCANPSLAGLSQGGFMVGWSQRDKQVPSNSWDVFARPFSSSGAGGPVSRINTQTYGDQFAPRLSAAGSDCLMVWTSLGQDNSMEGVYGQFLHADGSTNGGEFRVNTTWISRQMHPAIASDPNGRFLVTWTSFTGAGSSFDLFAQRYAAVAQPLQPMAPPFVYVPFIVSNGAYQPQIIASWPMQSGLPVDHYELYVDGTLAASPVTNTWTMTAANGLIPSSTHTFQISAVGSDGSRTPLSAAARATTWGGYNWAGIPFEWMAQFYGMDSSRWPSANGSLGQGAPTLYQVFLTGGNPLNSSTWLQTSLQVLWVQGQPVYMLHWNTQPGLTYQVQTSSDMVNWVDFQSPRFAADVADSVPVPKNNLQYYRLVRLR
jgi:hypothetical protein